MSYEIRAMSFGEILDMGIRLLRNHFLLLVGLAALFYVPFQLVLIELLMPGGEPGEKIWQLVAVLLLLAVLYPVVAAAITHAIGERYLGRDPTLGASLRVGLSILLPLIGTSLLAYLAIIVGLVLLILPGFYLAFAFLLLTQVMVLERSFGFDALGRSHELMKGRKLKGFGIGLVTSVLMGVLGVGVGIITAMLPGLGANVLDSLVQAIGFAFGTATMVVFYFDARCRHEAFDLEHLARRVEDAAPSAVAPAR